MYPACFSLVFARCCSSSSSFHDERLKKIVQGNSWMAALLFAVAGGISAEVIKFAYFAPKDQASFSEENEKLHTSRVLAQKKLKDRAFKEEESPLIRFLDRFRLKTFSSTLELREYNNRLQIAIYRNEKLLYLSEFIDKLCDAASTHKAFHSLEAQDFRAAYQKNIEQGATLRAVVLPTRTCSLKEGSGFGPVNFLPQQRDWRIHAFPLFAALVSFGTLNSLETLSLT